MTTLQERKRHIREEMLERRNALPAFKVLKRSNQVLDTLYGMQEFRDATVVLSYISFGTEVNTHGCIRSLLADDARQVLVPVVASRETRSMMLSELQDWSELSTGAYGILEPQPGCIRQRSAREVDLALVPGVAFDRQGHRIGYGGGYYDGLLQRIDGSAVALAYRFQMLRQLPQEPHDVRVDAVAMENEVARTG